MKLDRIISGGQTGADRAGLIAAKKLGLKTGGWMPKGMYAQDGKHPEFKELYGMKEHSSHLYPPRTELNAKGSDGTIRIASNFYSGGEILTLKFIKLYNKPFLDIDVKNPIDHEILLTWVIEHNITVLNVAGNSEKTSPGIQDWATKFLINTFEGKI